MVNTLWSLFGWEDAQSIAVQPDGYVLGAYRTSSTRTPTTSDASTQTGISCSSILPIGDTPGVSGGQGRQEGQGSWNARNPQGTEGARYPQRDQARYNAFRQYLYENGWDYQNDSNGNYVGVFPVVHDNDADGDTTRVDSDDCTNTSAQPPSPTNGSPHGRYQHTNGITTPGIQYSPSPAYSLPNLFRMEDHASSGTPPIPPSSPAASGQEDASSPPGASEAAGPSAPRRNSGDAEAGSSASAEERPPQPRIVFTSPNGVSVSNPDSAPHVPLRNTLREHFQHLRAPPSMNAASALSGKLYRPSSLKFRRHSSRFFRRSPSRFNFPPTKSALTALVRAQYLQEPPSAQLSPEQLSPPGDYLWMAPPRKREKGKGKAESKDKDNDKGKAKQQDPPAHLTFFADPMLPEPAPDDTDIEAQQQAAGVDETRGEGSGGGCGGGGGGGAPGGSGGNDGDGDAHPDGELPPPVGSSAPPRSSRESSCFTFDSPLVVFLAYIFGFLLSAGVIIVIVLTCALGPG